MASIYPGGPVFFGGMCGDDAGAGSECTARLHTVDHPSSKTYLGICQ